jgi:hypothetical protein
MAAAGRPRCRRPVSTRPETPAPLCAPLSAPSWRTLIISRRCGVSSAATMSRISAWLRGEARRKILSFMPDSARRPVRRRAASCGSSCLGAAMPEADDLQRLAPGQGAEQEQCKEEPFHKPCPDFILPPSLSRESPIMKIETIAVHGGYSPDPTTKAVAVPIYQTTSYAFDDTQHGADLFDLKVAGNIYTRIMNPTTDVLEKRMAELEGGIAALGVASGMAAITYAIQTIAEAGDNIVSVGTLYGGTYNLFAHTLPQYGIEVRFADYRNPEVSSR